LARPLVGRSETHRQLIDTEVLRRFATAVGADLEVERQTPLLAHWAFFLEVGGGAGRDRP